MAHYDDVKTQNVALIGLIGAIAAFIAILLVMVVHNAVLRRQETLKQIDQAPVETQDLLASQQAELNNYRWLKQVEEDGRKRDVYAVPISRAMTLVVEEYARGAGFQPAGVKPRSTPAEEGESHAKP